MPHIWTTLTSPATPGITWIRSDFTFGNITAWSRSSQIHFMKCGSEMIRLGAYGRTATDAFPGGLRYGLGLAGPASFYSEFKLRPIALGLDVMMALTLSVPILQFHEAVSP